MAAEADVTRPSSPGGAAEEPASTSCSRPPISWSCARTSSRPSRRRWKATPLLDRFAVSGVIASWWGVSLPDLKALATLGYRGLIEAWVATVLDALEEEKAKVDPLDHKVARALLPEYLDRLATLEAEVAELDSTIKAATAAR